MNNETFFICVQGEESGKVYGEQLEYHEHMTQDEHDILFDNIIDEVENAHFNGNESALIVKSYGETVTIANNNIARMFLNDNIYDIVFD